MCWLIFICRRFGKSWEEGTTPDVLKRDGGGTRGNTDPLTYIIQMMMLTRLGLLFVVLALVTATTTTAVGGASTSGECESPLEQLVFGSSWSTTTSSSDITSDSLEQQQQQGELVSISDANSSAALYEVIPNVSISIHRFPPTAADDSASSSSGSSDVSSSLWLVNVSLCNALVYTIEYDPHGIPMQQAYGWMMLMRVDDGKLYRNCTDNNTTECFFLKHLSHSSSSSSSSSGPSSSHTHHLVVSYTSAGVVVTARIRCLHGMPTSMVQDPLHDSEMIIHCNDTNDGKIGRTEVSLNLVSGSEYVCSSAAESSSSSSAEKIEAELNDRQLSIGLALLVANSVFAVVVVVKWRQQALLSKGTGKYRHVQDAHSDP